jgi:hypothetical protein
VVTFLDAFLAMYGAVVDSEDALCGKRSRFWSVALAKSPAFVMFLFPAAFSSGKTSFLLLFGNVIATSIGVGKFIRQIHSLGGDQ